MHSLVLRGLGLSLPMINEIQNYCYLKRETSDWHSAALLMRCHAAECVRVHSDGTRWIVGTGFKHSWFGSELLHSDQLDADITRELCVYLKDFDCHSVWLNSVAMDVFVLNNNALIGLWKSKGWICCGVLKEDAADAACELLPQLSLDEYVLSIKRMHQTLLAHGVVGYQEACLDVPVDNISKVAAYLQVFDGIRAYEQPRVRGLLRMRPGADVEDILVSLKKLQVFDDFQTSVTFLTHP